MAFIHRFQVAIHRTVGAVYSSLAAALLKIRATWMKGHLADVQQRIMQNGRAFGGHYSTCEPFLTYGLALSHL